ncbi:MAG: hypothetical protein HQM04_19370 [Magnetococcales bacterium]|nr:hypothetical protein [Magnetococcales bacterium]
MEPIVPPPLPYHILAQQIMALALQESGIGIHSWRNHIGAMPGFAAMEVRNQEEIIQHMLMKNILFSDGGILMMGDGGEQTFGRRHFMELMSVFISPPMYTVLHGRKEIGQVHQHSFNTNNKGPAVLTLAGQNWQVVHIDWSQHTAFVEPSKEKGKSNWLGEGQPMHFDLCQAVVRVLLEQTNGLTISNRGEELLRELREQFAWLEPGKSVLISDGVGQLKWWNFAGAGFNRLMRNCLEDQGIDSKAENYALTLHCRLPVQDIVERIRSSLDSVMERKCRAGGLSFDDIKFSQCVSAEELSKMQTEREFLCVFADHPGRCLTVLRYF